VCEVRIPEERLPTTKPQVVRKRETTEERLLRAEGIVAVLADEDLKNE